eukprot:3900354-Pyramimonas_sp.AAC.2
MLVPIRHLRPHVGFVWLLHQKSHGGHVHDVQHEFNDTVKQMMEIVETGAAFSSYTYGLVFSSADRSCVVAPPDL